MAAISHGRHFLGMIFLVVYVLATLVLFASAGKGDIEKPKFTYIERYKVKISFAKGVNRTLYICCNSTFLNDDLFLAKASCGVELMRSMCPKYNILHICKTRGQQVYCVVDGVQDKVTLEAYVAMFDGRTSVQLSKVATYFTNKSEIVPNSVSTVNVTTNSQQGLVIHWTPLKRLEISLANDYEYLIECQPDLGNRRAKAVRKSVEMTDSFLVINAKNVTAVSKYRCCVQVVNLVNSQPSEPTCQNVTTSEQVPSAGPVITCGNGTIPCNSVFKGTKRNITITFELPSLEDRNGKIIKSKVYYRSMVSRNFTEREINGSETEVVITNVETGNNYYVFMTSCTKIGCGPISNTIRIAAVSFNQKSQPTSIVNLAVSIVVPVLIVVVIIVIIAYCIKRHHWRQRQETLPTLRPITDPAYQYPHYKSKEDEVYHELDDGKGQATVLCNPKALVFENGNISNMVVLSV